MQALDAELAHLTEVRGYEVRLRNTKDVDISLWDFSVMFSQGGERLFSCSSSYHGYRVAFELAQHPTSGGSFARGTRFGFGGCR